MRTRLAIIAALTLATSVGAQPVADHLKCYRIIDPQPKRSYTADLGGLVAQPGCSIRVPAVIACVPTTKTNVTPSPPGGGATGTPNAFGCYRIKCPDVTLPTLPLADQFGNRLVSPLRAKLLCAPAVPLTTTTSTSTSTTVPPCGGTYPSCGGACPDGELCTATFDTAQTPPHEGSCACISSGGACDSCTAGQACVTSTNAVLVGCAATPVCGEPSVTYPDCVGGVTSGYACQAVKVTTGGQTLAYCGFTDTQPCDQSCSGGTCSADEACYGNVGFCGCFVAETRCCQGSASASVCADVASSTAATDCAAISSDLGALGGSASLDPSVTNVCDGSGLCAAARSVRNSCCQMGGRCVEGTGPSFSADCSAASGVLHTDSACTPAGSCS